MILEVVGGTDSDGGTTQVDEGDIGSRDSSGNTKAKVVRWATDVRRDSDAEDSLDDGDEDDVHLPLGKGAAKLRGLADGRGDLVVGSGVA